MYEVLDLEINDLELRLRRERYLQKLYVNTENVIREQIALATAPPQTHSKRIQWKLKLRSMRVFGPLYTRSQWVQSLCDIYYEKFLQ